MPTMGNRTFTAGNRFRFATALAGFFERLFGDAVFFMSVVHAAFGFEFLPGKAERGEAILVEMPGSRFRV